MDDGLAIDKISDCTGISIAMVVRIKNEGRDAGDYGIPAPELPRWCITELMKTWRVAC